MATGCVGPLGRYPNALAKKSMTIRGLRKKHKRCGSISVPFDGVWQKASLAPAVESCDAPSGLAAMGG